MTSSILIARLIGPFFLIAGLVAIFRPNLLKEIAREIIAGRALLFLAGVLALGIGLAIVNTHNIWTGWPVTITLLGWISVLAGVARMAFPDLIRPLGERMIARDSVLRLAGASQILLGGFFSVMGYF